MAKITCQLCGEQTHSIQLHLKEHHNNEYTIDDYKALYPDAPLLSTEAEEAIKEKRQRQQRVAMAGAATAVQDSNVASIGQAHTQPLHELFNLGRYKSAKSSTGGPIPINVLPKHEHEGFVPDQDPNYVWPVEILKNALMGIELNIPTYLWGHAGTGKSTIWEQICHYTNRPMFRVQHTANMEEADVLGRWTVKDGETHFELGPLPVAMLNGYVYLADEYDFAFPNVLGVYQPVLEGKPLIIKEADAKNRVIHPHPDFRFVATGNTNGSGDETGLYQGTNLQNAANYSRFGIVEKVNYMQESQEVRLLMGQADVVKEDAQRLVNFANEIRNAHDRQEIGSTIGPRELIFAGMVGSRKNSLREGVNLSWANKLSAVDFEVANGLAQRIFG